jgi:hypothetical protein
VLILRCRHTGGILVFCLDDTIQRFAAGPSYERQWSVQGLASTELYVDEGGVREEVGNGCIQQVAMKGPIIIVKDPTTNYPMLTKLPGAPGMVHWYDPRSASVIGTLKVAPFNQVSCKDHTSDPHITTPMVKHMAVGQSCRCWYWWWWWWWIKGQRWQFERLCWQPCVRDNVEGTQRSHASRRKCRQGQHPSKA